MSGCAYRRWGPGTTCERPSNTAATKEMEAKLAALKAEREKQDARFQGVAAGQVSLSPGSETPLSRVKNRGTS